MSLAQDVLQRLAKQSMKTLPKVTFTVAVTSSPNEHVRALRRYIREHKIKVTDDPR